MQAALAVILLLLLAGLLWSLWFVVTNPRRRARHIAVELSAPAGSSSAPFVVGYKRWSNLAGGAFFAIIAANIAARTTTPVSVGAITLCVVLVAWQIRLALGPKSVLVIDGDGITLVRKRRSLRWEDVETMSIEERSGVYGIERHSLILTLTAIGCEAAERMSRGVVTSDGESVTILLGLLSPNWDQIARAIYQRSGRRPVVPHKYAPAQT